MERKKDLLLRSDFSSYKRIVLQHFLRYHFYTAVKEKACFEKLSVESDRHTNNLILRLQSIYREFQKLKGI